MAVCLRLGDVQRRAQLGGLQVGNIHIGVVVAAGILGDPAVCARGCLPFGFGCRQGRFVGVGAVQLHGGGTVFAHGAARRGLQRQAKVPWAGKILGTHGDGQGQVVHAEGEYQLGVHLGIVAPGLSRALAGGLHLGADHGVHGAGALHRNGDALTVCAVNGVREVHHGRLLLLIVHDGKGAGGRGGVGGGAAGRAENDVEHPVAVADVVVLGYDLQIFLGLAGGEGQFHRGTHHHVGHHVGNGLQILHHIAALSGQALGGGVLAGEQVGCLLHGVNGLVADGEGLSVLNGRDGALVPVGNGLDLRLQGIGVLLRLG